ncbi:MAG TPA: TonB-dependent receptor [Bacteroidota bacterium]|nr:TonB-dependent receptor [Bacteroidota bacterium]
MSAVSKTGFRKKWLAVLMIVSASLLCGPGASAQMKSRIVGTVTDAKTGEALVGVNVFLMDTYLGATSDVNGKYFIIGVPVGTYRLQASMLGYTKKIITDVEVSSDRVSTVDITLESGEIQMEAVTIEAKRDELHKEVTNTQLVVNAKEVTQGPAIREINEFLANQPGVSETNGYLTIRGGSADQTGTLVNGISFNNAAVGNAETSIPLSAIDQISVLSGGFNAEYGNFRSGLINVTTKTGTKDGFHGTLTFTYDGDHMKRFGPNLNDPSAPLLAPYLNPSVAFVGTDSAWKNDPYTRQQSLSFIGWNKAAQQFNIGKSPAQQATPLDMYLLYSWMFMAVPDYQGLAKLGYTVSDEQKALFASHARKEGGSDYDFDGGFGGPIPFLSDLGATFYLSNNTTRQTYTMPVSRDAEQKYVTLATIHLEPSKSTSVTLNGLWKFQEGVSGVRPAFGDVPDANGYGGFMPIDNVKDFVRNTNSSEYRMYWFDPPFFPLLNQTSLLGGITVNHIFSQSTFAEFAMNYLSILDENPEHGDNRDTADILTWFGPFPVDEMPYGKWQFAGNHKLAGYTYPSYDDAAGLGVFRFRSKEGDLYDNTNIKQWRFKADVNSQLNEANYAKAGIEYNLIDINHNYWEDWNRNAYNIYEFNYHRIPSQTGVYLQDQITSRWMLANLGVRVDYYYGGGGLWPSGDPFAAAAFTPRPYGKDSALVQYLQAGNSYIWNLWDTYNQTHPGFLQPVKNYVAISPRLGISFPISDNSKFYFNYGHFRSNPTYSNMFLIQYRYTKNGLYMMSNPNLEPPRTISYEIGVGQALSNAYQLNVSGYYKDVTGEAGDVTYQNAAGDLNYDSWNNNTYEDIEGVEVTLTKQDRSWINGRINFNYSLKKTGLTGQQTYTDSIINDAQALLYQGQESRVLPQPSVNATVTFTTPDGTGKGFIAEQVLGGWELTLFGKWQAGSYYTWNPLNDPYLNQNLEWPDYWMFDLKLNKAIGIAGKTGTFYVDVKNVFNIKVNEMNTLFAFDRLSGDDFNYFASLHLAMYNSPAFNNLRAQYAAQGYFVPGDDKIGQLRSADKPYINDPNLPYFIYGEPREIWAGIKVDF